MRPGKQAALDKTKRVDQLIDQHVTVRYRGLKNNTAQLSTLFALSTLWMARKTLRVPDGPTRPQPARAA